MTRKQYEDTKAGVLECLKDETTYDLTQVKSVFPDPHALGVWGVDLFSGTRVIVYLRGHGDNKDKPYNDFEEV